jgi:hypothetical protein
MNVAKSKNVEMRWSTSREWTNLVESSKEGYRQLKKCRSANDDDDNDDDNDEEEKDDDDDDEYIRKVCCS